MSEYRALYRKWRPVDFDDVCGQKSITDILKYEVANDKISHAYLFCGSRGTGKTSCAKILAKAVNCLSPRNGNPCNECEACRSIDRGSATDVIEMDAASNNGVNNVRDMKDEIAFTPAELKYRVYIVDEVHMMSAAAFNALLKTLEEPPSYVVFILATTEFNKLPTTIVSRCQRFDFRRMTSEVIISRLMHIAEREGIDLTEDGARIIARAAQGGMRDAVSLLELCAGSRERVDEKLVSETVGAGSREGAYRVIGAIANEDYNEIYATIADAVSISADLSVFWQSIIDSYRDIMVAKCTKDAKAYLDLTDVEYSRLTELSARFSMARLSYHVTILEGALADMQRAQNSKRSIAEIALTRMCDAKASSSPEALALRIEELERELSKLKFGAPIVEKTQKPIEKSEQKQEIGNNTPAESPATAPQKSAPPAQNEAFKPYERWARAVERIGELKRSLSVQFISAQAMRRGCEFVITMSPFFATRLTSSEDDLRIVKGVIAELEKLDIQNVKIKVVPNVGKDSRPIDDLDKIDF